MSGVSLPVNRPIGRALVVGGASNRSGPVEILQRLYSFDCTEADDPYTAMIQLCRRKTVYNAVILSLASLYREELVMIGTIKRRFPHLEVWLTHTDGRQAALAEGMRLGADGLLGEDGLHRIAPQTPPPAKQSPSLQLVSDSSDEDRDSSSDADVEEADSAAGTRSSDETAIGEPVLSADELRALLQDQPAMPPPGSGDPSQD